MHDVAGNPANFPITVSAIDDSDAPNATNFNTAIGGLADRTAYLYAQLGHGDALNWTTEFQFTTGIVGQGFAWDPKKQQWLYLYEDGGGVSYLQVTLGLDLGAAAAWTAIGTSFTAPSAPSFQACMADPTTAGHYWCTVCTAAGAAFEIWLWNGSTWSRSPGTWTSITPGGGNAFFGTELATLNGYVIAGVTGDGAGDTQIYASNNGFTTWVSAGSAPGGSIVFPPLGGSGGFLYMKSNGVQCVAFQGGEVGATNLYHVYVTTDGHSWTDSASLAGLLPAGGWLCGLAWTRDSLGPCWLAAFSTATAGMLFFRSPDGIVWTASAGGFTTAMTVADMAAVGSTVVCTLVDASSGGPSATIFSPDGAATWYPGPANFTSNVTTPGARSRVVASSTGFLLGNGKYLRFSLLTGLPAPALT